MTNFDNVTIYELKIPFSFQNYDKLCRCISNIFFAAFLVDFPVSFILGITFHLFIVKPLIEYMHGGLQGQKCKNKKNGDYKR